MNDTIRFATSNHHKLKEAERLLQMELIQVEIDLEEIQASTIEAIALDKLSRARGDSPLPIIVEDVALGLEALSGFPGPFVKWWMERAGGDALGLVAQALGDHRATATCCLAFWDGAKERVFTGSVDGVILTEPRGSREFGWDAWFVPDGSASSFGEMTSDEKDRVSHRGRAYRKLAAILDRSS